MPSCSARDDKQEYALSSFALAHDDKWFVDCRLERPVRCCARRIVAMFGAGAHAAAQSRNHGLLDLSSRAERELSEAMRARSRGIYAFFFLSDSGYHPSARSLQAGFMLTINRTFLILLQRLICFSRAIALFTYL